MKMLLPNKIGDSGRDNDAMAFWRNNKVTPSDKGFGSGVAVYEETSCGAGHGEYEGSAGIGRGMSQGFGHSSCGAGCGYH